LYNRLFALRNGEFTQDKEKSVRDLYMCLFFSVGLNLQHEQCSAGVSISAPGVPILLQNKLL